MTCSLIIRKQPFDEALPIVAGALPVHVGLEPHRQAQGVEAGVPEPVVRRDPGRLLLETAAQRALALPQQSLLQVLHLLLRQLLRQRLEPVARRAVFRQRSRPTSLPALVLIDDDDALMNVDLSGGKTYAFLRVHGFEHIIYNVL